MRRLLIVFSILAIFVSCGNKPKLIPEDELGDIIVQSVVTESFLRNTGKLGGYSDTLNYYLPVLDKYGYTVEDVKYTIERMVQRKSNVFGQLMDKISNDVGAIKNRYEYLSDMGRNWRALVKNKIVDTLFFSPDSIRITNYDDLKMLDYKVPVNANGEIIVRYNYKINSADSNYSRYFTYNFYDSISKRRLSKNDYWLSKNDNKRAFEREIPIHNSRRGNVFDMRVMAFSSREEMPSKKDIRGIDFYIDSVTILFRPQYEVAERRMLKRLNVPIITDINYLTSDSLNFVTPYNPIYGGGVPVRDSVRYNKILPKAVKK